MAWIVAAAIAFLLLILPRPYFDVLLCAIWGAPLVAVGLFVTWLSFTAGRYSAERRRNGPPVNGRASS